MTGRLKKETDFLKKIILTLAHSTSDYFLRER